MKLFSFGLFALSVAGISACEQEKFSNSDMALMELPHWTLSTFESPAFKNSYTFDTSINPFYLNVDVDGNTTTDLAAVIVERASGRRGIAILMHDSDSLQIFGAGNKNTLGGNNWKWLIGWKAEERLTGGAGKQKSVGTTFILYTNKGSANWMYWDGKDWEWTAQ